MAIKEQCQERNIKKSQYYYWLKTLHKEGTGSGELEQQASPFVELSEVLAYMPSDVKQYGRIYLAYGYTGLRFGIDGLARTVQDNFSLNPFQKDILFLFCGRRTDRIKGLL